MHSLCLSLNLVGSRYTISGGGGGGSGDWILATGFWADAGVWQDDQTWID